MRIHVLCFSCQLLYITKSYGGGVFIVLLKWQTLWNKHVLYTHTGIRLLFSFLLLSFPFLSLSLLPTSIIIISFSCLCSLLTQWCLLKPCLICTLQTWRSIQVIIVTVNQGEVNLRSTVYVCSHSWDRYGHVTLKNIKGVDSYKVHSCLSGGRGSSSMCYMITLVCV